MRYIRSFLAIMMIALAAIVTAPIAAAGDPEVEAAIDAGLVGERIDGYLGVVGQVSPSVSRKVQEINNKRRALYEQLAEETGTSIAEVARITGEKQIAKAEDGEMFMGESAVWQKK